MKVEEIERLIDRLPFIRTTSPLVVNSSGTISGAVGILDEGLPTALCFHMEIRPYYPYKIRGLEPIVFFNPDLIEYPHVMSSGDLCLHTSYWSDPLLRLESDFYQLLEWVQKYYIKGEKDSHYEHIVVSDSSFDDHLFSLNFTQLDTQVKSREYGYAHISPLEDGINNGQIVKNYLLKSILDANSHTIHKCLWADCYFNLPHFTCPYFILELAPCKHNKFALNNYNELTPFFTDEQRTFLHQFESSQIKKRKGEVVPILLGYKIPTGELHWLASISKIGEFPTEGQPQRIDGIKTKTWLTCFKEEKIHWATSFDASYNLFFGRGAFDSVFSRKAILILGLGAVGSIVATTLTRCGCTDLTIYDFDLKKSENVCRSEYDFLSGVCDKTSALSDRLHAISPHLIIKTLRPEFEQIIKLAGEEETKINELNKFDYIIDCTTDNDLMDILEELHLKASIVNLSISNHASELVCAFSPNVSRFVRTAFDSIIQNDYADMYEPTGCWSPTFKASYNDIAIMVQYAIRHIYQMLSGKTIQHNFILKDTEEGLKITKY